MLSHVTIGTNDVERARAFYAAILGVIGGQEMPMGVSGERCSFAREPREPMIVVTKPFDGQPATSGNGMMIGLRCKDKAEVQAVYDLAMELGAKSEGEVGPRGDAQQFYGGYFRDPDGNKLSAFTMNG